MKLMDYEFPTHAIDSLYKICIDKTYSLIQKNYWKIDTSPNPFIKFHPNVIHDLIEHVCRHVQGHLKSSSLHLLLVSGRVTDFVLKDLELEINVAEDIFHDLKSSTKILKSIKIQNVFLDSSDTCSNLGHLIRKSKLLKLVETCISFVLSELYFSDSLEELNLNFVIRDSFRSFSVLRRKARYNYSLKILTISTPQTNPNVHLKIADIMQYCPDLVEIYYNMIECLEYLYEKNMSKTYKLQKTTLGSDICPFARRATEKTVSIAASICPDLRVLEVTPEDYNSIHALKKLRCITELILNKPRWQDNNYHEGIHPLLVDPSFGTKLKSLTIRHFSRVDFASIGTCCPNIEDLEVEYFSEDNSSDFPQNAFQKLINLNLFNLYNEPCEASTLHILLFNSSALEFLKIRNASTFTDVVIDTILENENALSKLRALILTDIGLTVTGLKKLGERLKSVQHVLVSSRTLNEMEATFLKQKNTTFFMWTKL